MFSRRLIPYFFFACLPLAASAAEPLSVIVDAIGKTGGIAPKFAACIADGAGKSTHGKNLRPTVRWSAGPQGTQSYLLAVTDPDVPADLSIANQGDLLIAEDMPRQTFYHWVQFNIGAKISGIPGGKMPAGFGVSASNDVGGADYKLGYGGPCPPWNDAQLHHYHFTVYALDRKLPLPEGAPARAVVKAMEGHVLAQGEAVGSFTTNPAMLKDD